jgi:hypothetical protein
MDVRSWAKASVVLTVLALLAVAVSHLALTDIYHAEGDVGLEWAVLRACVGTIVTAQLAAVITLVRIVRQGPRHASA